MCIVLYLCLPWDRVLIRRKRNVTKERKERAEEKKRLEEMAARMSAKKLQRLRKVRYPFNPLLTMTIEGRKC